jgi:hypothetical protein
MYPVRCNLHQVIVLVGITVLLCLSFLAASAAPLTHEYSQHPLSLRHTASQAAGPATITTYFKNGISWVARTLFQDVVIIAGLEVIRHIPSALALGAQSINRGWHRYYYGADALCSEEITLIVQHLYDLMGPVLTDAFQQKEKSSQSPKLDVACLSPVQQRFFIEQIRSYNNYVIDFLQHKRAVYGAAQCGNSYLGYYKKQYPFTTTLALSLGAAAAGWIFYKNYAINQEAERQRRADQDKIVHGYASVATGMGDPLNSLFNEATLAMLQSLHDTSPSPTKTYSYASRALIAGMLLYVVQLRYIINPPTDAIIIHINETLSSLRELNAAVCELHDDRHDVTQRILLFNAVINSLQQVGLLIDQGPCINPALYHEIRYHKQHDAHA